jgi:hypothetical protein
VVGMLWCGGGAVGGSGVVWVLLVRVLWCGGVV